MGEIAEGLHELEERLHRLLSAGWRTESGDRAYFETTAQQLEGMGLVALAGRARAVSEAASPAEALAAVALVSASVRMLLSRLPGDGPGADWESDPRSETRRSAEHLLPLARMEVRGREQWDCARLRGAVATEWVLLEPPAMDSAAGMVAPVPSAERRESTGLLHFIRGKGGSNDRENRVWLRQQIEGHSRWLKRLPLGADGDVQICACEDAGWRTTDSDPTDHFRQALASGRLTDGMSVVGYAGPIQVKELSREAADDYAWCDPDVARIFKGRAGASTWTIAWVQRGLIAPLAIVVIGGLLHPPQLIHLVGGGVVEPVAV